MPSIRKRIGYLPSVNIQEIISKIANNEKLSQSKVVGMLVEEALIARGLFDFQNTNELTRKYQYINEKNIANTSLNDNDLDELISDKGITYNTKRYKLNSNQLSSKSEEASNEELVDQFKQFLLFQKMIKEK